MDAGVLLGFVAASVLLVAIPGPNAVYILTRSAADGRRAGLVSALGVETGTLVHVALATSGLSAVVASSPPAFTALRLAGAGYLVVLAVRARRSRPHIPTTDVPMTARPTPPRSRSAFRDGLIINVLNPKVGVFFIAFFPQFAPTAQPIDLLFLGAVFFVVALSLDVVYALAGSMLSERLHPDRRGRSPARFVVAAIYLVLASYTIVTI